MILTDFWRFWDFGLALQCQAIQLITFLNLVNFDQIYSLPLTLQIDVDEAEIFQLGQSIALYWWWGWGE